MAYIYVSTDQGELEELINPDEETGIVCRDISMHESAIYKSMMSFAPMSIAEIRRDKKYVEMIAGKLSENGLFVAADFGTRIKEYRPKDLDYRNMLLKVALQNDSLHRWAIGNSPCAYNLILFSNNILPKLDEAE